MTHPEPTTTPAGGLPAELRELANEFAFEGVVGRGGTAVVYRARELALDRLVAIKVIRSRYVDDDELVARLEREARLVAQLDHPNVVGLYAVRRLERGTLALVMQYVNGSTLRQEMQRHGALPIGRARRVLTDVGQALAAAHAHRVVHRDVKPENIHLAGTPTRALLGDFGSAAPLSAESRLTMTGVTIGTPGYLAPELVDGETASPSADVYALGLVGWEMLTGRQPWEGSSLFDVLAFRKHGTLPPVESLRPDVPSSLAAAIGGALQRDPADRWPSMQVMLDTMAELERTARGHPLRPAARPVVAAPIQPLDAPDEPSTQADTQRIVATPLGAATAAAPSGVPIAPSPGSSTTPDLPPAEAVRDGAGRGRGLRRAVLGVGLAGAALVAALVVPQRMGRVDPGAVVSTERDAVLAREIPMTAPTPPVAAPATDSGTPAVDTGRADSATLALGETTAATPLPVEPAEVRASTTPPPAARQETPSPAPPVTADSAPSGRGAPTARGDLTAVTPSTAAPAPIAPIRTPVPAPAPTPTSVPARGSSEAEVGAPLSAVRAVSLGGMHSCALTGGGSVRCWGANDQGQLGPGEERASLVAAPVEGSVRFRSVALGLAHSCGLTNDGVALCWGANDDGQLGDGTRSAHAVASRVTAATRFTSIALGAAHSCAVSADGLAYCWGSNASGQLGTGRSGGAARPVPIAGPWRVTDLAVGWHHSCAITEDARAVCWGANGAGQLGTAGGDRRTPAPVQGIGPLRALAAGSAHTCALLADGEVSCWGRNRNGQIGDGTTTDTRAPRAVKLPAAAVRVAAGGTHTCALLRGGDVYCWGQNRYGQLGDGTILDRRTPVRVAGAPDFVSLAASGAHTCGVTGGGDVYCWGYNLDGQLGDGTRSNRTRPVVVRRHAD